MTIVLENVLLCNFMLGHGKYFRTIFELIGHAIAKLWGQSFFSKLSQFAVVPYSKERF